MLNWIDIENYKSWIYLKIKMSENLYYNFVFPLAEDTEQETLENFISLIKNSNYNLFSPDDNLIIGVIGSEAFEADNQEQVIKDIAEQGGLIKLWGKSLDISLWFNRIDYRFGEASIIVDDSYFSEDSANREFISEYFNNLFIETAKNLKADFAYVIDQYKNDIFDFESNSQLVSTNGTPVISWLNYFSNDYFEQVGGKRVLKDFNFDITEIHPTGLLVTFFTHPWQVDILELELLNEKWREIQIFKDILK